MMADQATEPPALAELRRWPRWVMWRTVVRDGKPTKVPLMPNGRAASSTDPKTWSTYEECDDALALAANAFDGVGYVFAEDDEYAGIDLDKCVQVHAPGSFAAAAGPNIDSEAWKVVRQLDSYTEFSPTGTGLHILVRAGLNGGRKKTDRTPWKGAFENYDRERFFTITGRHVAGTPVVIEARQKQLDAVRAQMFPAEKAKPKQNGKPLFGATTASTLDDVEMEKKIRESKQGAQFAELFDRGAAEGQESEADLSLCNILAFWVGPDESRIDAWFRRSALMRDKWDAKRGDTTYGGYTIARSLEGRTEFYGQKKPTSTSAQRAKDDNPEMSYADEISTLFGIIDDPVVHGWRSKRGANCRVVFTTRSGATLDLESWKVATTSARALNQEIAIQLGVEAALTKENVSRLNVLMGKFCLLAETKTVDARARELGEQFLTEATEHLLDWEDQDARHEAFKALRERHPSVKAREQGTSIATESLVLVDRSSGKRYVRSQWFTDYVKASAPSGMTVAILEAIEQPGWWSRPNTQSRYIARSAKGGKPLTAVMFEVPADWGQP